MKLKFQPDQLILRQENEADWFETEAMTREAFWNLFKAGCDEHFLLHRLRTDPAYLPALAIVAEYEGRIIGSIHYTLATVSTDEQTYEVITFGPVSVLPEYQKLGIGSLLIRHTIELAKALGYPAIIIHGHPAYYPRFGFRSFEGTGITTAQGTTPDYFMGLELREQYFSSIQGIYHEAAAFTGYTETEVAAFDAQFPAMDR